MYEECKKCDIKQVDKICTILKLDSYRREELRNKVISFLDKVDMDKTNPEVMGDIWEIISEDIKNENPYKDVKTYLNKKLLNSLPYLKKLVYDSSCPKKTALQLAIAGNLIDFAASHKFEEEDIEKKLIEITKKELSINHSEEMFKDVESAESILYLGDNCGEIVLDKLFITVLKENYPNLEIYYGVRGKPIVNDVTVEDAKEVKMNEVSQVLSNGDGSLGTELKKTSSEFNKIFNDVHMVICKGQGNYESLINCNRENLYFMFMAKCNMVAKPLNIPTMSVVCMKK